MLPQLILPYPSFCFFVSVFICHCWLVRETACHTICVPFPVFTSGFLSVLCSGWWWWWWEGMLCHHRSFCSPLSIKCSVESVRQGRMFNGVEILRERNDGWETLSEPRAKHFLTSSGSVDEHWPWWPRCHWPLCNDHTDTHTHACTRTHTQSRRRLGYN